MSVHRLGLATFVLAWFHGVLSGTDAVAVRLVYAVTALIASLIGMSLLVSYSQRPDRATSGERTSQHGAHRRAGGRRDRDPLAGVQR